MNDNNIERMIEEYLNHQHHIDVLQKTVDQYKGSLATMIQEGGQEDEKGNQWLQIGKFFLQRQRREGKRVLNKEKAEAWAKEKGIWESVSQTVEVLDEDAILGYVFECRDDGQTEEEFADLYDPPRITYAFLKPVEDSNYDY